MDSCLSISADAVTGEITVSSLFGSKNECPWDVRNARAGQLGQVQMHVRQRNNVTFCAMVKSERDRDLCMHGNAGVPFLLNHSAMPTHALTHGVKWSIACLQLPIVRAH